MIQVEVDGIKKLYSFDDQDRVHLGFHEGQSKAWKSDARIVLMLAGTQGGKTSFGPWWLWREVKRRGRGDYLAVTTNYDLFKLKMLPEMRTVFEWILGIGRYWVGDRVIELRDPETNLFWAKRASDPMWGRIILRSAGSESGLESATANAAWLDEMGMDEWDIRDWEAIIRRLSLTQGRVLGTSTVYNSGWTKTEIYDRWADGDPDYYVVQFDSVVNPAFPDAEFQRAERTMPEWKFNMYYRGRYARPAGLIYGGAFDEAKDVVSDDILDEISAHWRRVVGLDFGGVNNAKLWITEHPEETVEVLNKDGKVVQESVWYIYHESLGPGTSREHASVIKQRSKAENIYDMIVVGGSPSEVQARNDLRDHGVDIFQPLIGDLEAGIERVYELFKSGRLKVVENCTGLRDEVMKYSRKLDSSGEPTEVIKDKNKFHRLDALRYGAIEITEGHKRKGTRKVTAWRPK